MPIIASPPNAGLRDWRPDDGHPVVRGTSATRPIMLRMRVAARRDSLTQALSGGADPATSPELAMWAARLTRDRHRRVIARTLRRTIADAHHPTLTRYGFVLIRRRAVIDAEHEFDALIKRLHSPEPVAPRGMALIQRIVTDGGWSPMYSPAAPGALRHLIALATEALDPAAPGELPGAGTA
jgi:hypothetical protein